MKIATQFGFPMQMYAMESFPAPWNSTLVAVGAGLTPFAAEVVSFATHTGALRYRIGKITVVLPFDNETVPANWLAAICPR